MESMQILFGIPVGLFSLVMSLESSYTRFLLKMKTFFPERSCMRFLLKMNMPSLSDSIKFLVEYDMLLFSQNPSFANTLLNVHFD